MALRNNTYGLTVPKFRALRKSNRSPFNISAYNNPSETAEFSFLDSDHIKTFHPTLFHKVLDQLARDGRLLRHYAQYID